MSQITLRGVFLVARFALRKYWFTLTWFCLCWYIFWSEFDCYKNALQFFYLRQMLGTAVCISRGTAAVINLCALSVFLPMMRSVLARSGIALPGCLRCWLPHSTFLPSKSKHILIAVTLTITSVIHSLTHFTNAVNFSRNYNSKFPEVNVATHSGQNPVILIVKSVPGVTGLLMLLIIITLAMTSLPFVRRRNYEVFYFTHLVSLIFAVLLILHPMSGVLKAVGNVDYHFMSCKELTMKKTDKHRNSNTSLISGNESFPAFLNQKRRNQISRSYIRKHAKSNESFQIIQSRSNTENYQVFNQENINYAGTKYPEKLAYQKDRISSYRDENKTVSKCSQPPQFKTIKTNTWKWMMLPLLCFLLDSILKFWRSRRRVQLVAVKTFKGDVLELTFQKQGLNCHPGQYVLLNCKDMSKFEWHPFTVIQHEEDADSFKIIMRTNGDWCKKLAKFYFPTPRSKYEDDSKIIYKTEYLKNSISKKYPKTKNYESLCRSSSKKSVRCDSLLNESLNTLFTYSDKVVPTTYNFNKKDESEDVDEIKITKNKQSILEKHKRRNIKKKHIKRLNKNKNNSELTRSFFMINFDVMSKSNSLPICDQLGKYYTQSTYITNNENNLCIKSCNSRCLYSKFRTKLNKNVKKLSISGDNLYATDFHKNYTRNVDFEDVRKASELCDVTTENQPKFQLKRGSSSEFKNPKYLSMKFFIEGPFNSPSEAILLYPVAIAISGGIGVTPLLSTLTYLRTSSVPNPKRIHVVWVLRESELLVPVYPMIKSFLKRSWERHQEDIIEIRIHITSHIDQTLIEDRFPVLKGRIFKGRPSWKDLFEWWTRVYKKSEVGVFCCGPPSLNLEISDWTFDAAKQGANFSFYHESFD